MKIAVITAGGAGMFCGSCMQDNTLVRTLRRAGADAVLIPTYTPIRVDEENVSQNRIFLGGINVYLDSAVPGWKRVPSPLTRWLNHPRVIRLLTQFSSSTDASRLGGLTVDLLSGSAGPQHREIAELVNYLSDDLQPDVVLFSNALLSGVVPQLRRRYGGSILTLLQGDDIFLEALQPRYKAQAIALLTQNCHDCDGILTHSQYYSRFMQTYLNLPASKFREIPLIVDIPAISMTEGRAAFNAMNAGRFSIPFEPVSTIGYFARICPEKGIQHFLAAAKRLAPQFPQTRFSIAGFLPEQHRRTFEKQLLAAQFAGSPGQIQWLGSPGSRDEKFAVLRSFDLLCVPSDYHEPKGLYVLEAAALGIPSLLPNHGAFPERVQTLGDGALFDPGSPDSLTDALRQYLQTQRASDAQAAQPSFAGTDSDRRSRLITAVQTHHGMDATAPQIMNTIRELAVRRPDTA